MNAPTVALLVMTDGRDDLLARTIASAEEHLAGPITEWWMHDDTGDIDHVAALADRYPHFGVLFGRDVHTTDARRLGFGGAIRSAWESLVTFSTATHIFHLEDDFIFRTRIDLVEMIRALTITPDLAQMALVRQPWNANERAAGGVVESNPDSYETIVRGAEWWLEHRVCFTTNPCVYPRRIIERYPWPAIRNSEGQMTHQMLADGLRFGYWHGPDVLAEHIGDHRVGSGY